MKHKQLLLILILMLLSFSCIFAQAGQSVPEEEDQYKAMALNIFYKLYDNDVSVESDIDWKVLVVDDDSVFVRYNALTTDADRQEFQTNAVSMLSDWLYIDEDDGDYYEWSFKKTDHGTYYLYGFTEYFDVYLHFSVSNDKLLLFYVSFVDYY